MNNYPFKKELKSFLYTYHKSDCNLYKDEEVLLANIARVIKYIVDNEYNTYITIHHPLIVFFESLRLELTKSSNLINGFEKSFNITNLYTKYKLLKPILNQLIESSDLFNKEILYFLEKDKILLEKILGINDFRIKDIKLDSGDVHQGGKSTTIITFKNDCKVVFKPRSGGLDVAFNQLIDKYNLYDKDINLRKIKIIDRSTYCWCEFITNNPCNAIKDINTYYIKAGILSAFLYLLQGADMHFENVIACGENPMLIDIECLFNNTKMGHYNILSTGFIPLLTLDNNAKQCFDLSGLGANGKIENDHRNWKWKNLETDALNLEKVSGYMKAEGNQPKFNGKAISPENYMDYMVLGLEKAFNWIFFIQQQIDSENNNPFSQFQNQIFRIVPRETQIYNDILENSFTPNSLKSEEDRNASILLGLNKYSFYLQSANSIQRENIVESEFKAIKRLDIPYFTGNTSKNYIKESDDIVINDFFAFTPYESILMKLKSFNYFEAEEQIKILRSAFISRYNITLPQTQVFNLDIKKDINIKERINTEIRGITSKINRDILIFDAEVTWSCFLEEENNSIFKFIDISLYNGKIGIALFLNYVSIYLNTSKYDHIIKSIISKEIEQFEINDHSKPINISFCTGISGLIYAILKCKSNFHLNVAIKLSTLITKDKIRDEKNLDIMKGSAGILIILCELYIESKAPEILDKCIMIGEHLLDNSIVDKHTKTRSWVSITNLSLTGFSHGASGIGYSLLKLYSVTNTEKYKGAFYESVRFESSHYSETHQNWLDLRSNDEKYQNAWCHGAAGIGLSRIYAYKITKDESLLIDIYNAIEATKRMDLSAVDHYCCGNMGRIDFLIEAAEILKDEELLNYCTQMISSLIDKKDKLGYYQTYQNPSISIENPTLFKGTAGIGYIFLKFLHNKELPSLGF